MRRTAPTGRKAKRATCTAEKLPANAFAKWERAYCPMLDKLLQVEGEPGFSPYVLTKLWGERAGEKNLAGIQWRPNRKCPPYLLNFCPFCGTSFTAWVEPHLKGKAA
jgi:hypothetical protein